MADRIASLLAVPDEIENVQASLATGNALISFDPSRVTEKDLVRYMRGMFEVFVNNRERFEGLAPERIPHLFERLEGVVRDAVHPHLRIDTQKIIENVVLE